MSLIKTKSIQLGWDLTPTNNFTIYQPATPDGTFRIATGNSGSETDVMTVSSDGSVTYAGTTSYAGLGFGTGSATAPSLYPNGDTNTGIYFPTAETIGFSTNGTEQARLTGTGLGIGTSTPGQKLDVRGIAQVINSAAGTATVLKLGNDDSSTTAIVKAGFSNSGIIKASINAAVYGNDYMTFNVGSDTERVRIDASGNLLVGTTSNLNYSSRLRVLAPSNGSAVEIYTPGSNYTSKVNLTNDSSGAAIASVAGNLVFYAADANNERMRITTAGHVLTPYRPAFFAWGSGVSAANTNFAFTSVEYNVGSSYNASTGRFTAPVAGLYAFSANALWVADGSTRQINLWKNGSAIAEGKDGSVGAVVSIGFTRHVYLSAGDYIELINSSGGAFISNASLTWMSGYLVG